MGYINSLIGVRSIYIVVFVVAVMMLILTIGKEEPIRVGTRDLADQASGSISAAESRERLVADKED